MQELQVEWLPASILPNNVCIPASVSPAIEKWFPNIQDSIFCPGQLRPNLTDRSLDFHGIANDSRVEMLA